jgi:hypothetical protein
MLVTRLDIVKSRESLAECTCLHLEIGLKVKSDDSYLFLSEPRDLATFCSFE